MQKYIVNSVRSSINEGVNTGSGNGLSPAQCHVIT